MGRDIQETKRRLLEAATNEFAQRGIAGARVDHIAELAGCSKALMYSYFGNKDQLFDAVYNALVVTILQDVPIDAADLANYTGQLFDQYQAHPEILRLTAWDILERAGAGTRLEVVQAANQNKIAAIEQAQREGNVSTQWSAAELLLLVTSISSMWALIPAQVIAQVSPDSAAQRRLLTEAVQRLVQKADEVACVDK